MNHGIIMGRYLQMHVHSLTSRAHVARQPYCEFGLATAPDSIRQKTHVGNVCVFGFVASCRFQVRDQTRRTARVDDDYYDGASLMAFA